MVTESKSRRRLDRTRPFSPDVPDLAQLREQHFALQRQRMGQDDETAELVGSFIEDVHRLRTDARDAGQWLADLGDRDIAQGIVDFWASVLTSEPDRRFPEMMPLAEYDPACKEAYQAHADAVFDRLKDEPDDELPGDVLFSLHPQWGANADLYLPRDRLMSLQSPRAAVIMKALVDAGLVRKVADPAGAKPALSIRHLRLLDDWSVVEIRAGLVEAAAFNRRRLETSARHWDKEPGRNRGLLLRGRALSDARAVRGLNETAEQFIAASVAARDRRWRQAVLTLIMVAALLAGTAWGVNDYLNTQETMSANAALDTVQDPANVAQLPSSEEVDKVATKPTPQEESLAMWVGSEALPMLLDAEGNPVVPGRGMRGTFFARTDIWLRLEPPDRETYANSIGVGIVRRGQAVEILSVYPSYRRESGDQFWAEVRRPNGATTRQTPPPQATDRREVTAKVPPPPQSVDADGTGASVLTGDIPADLLPAVRETGTTAQPVEPNASQAAPTRLAQPRQMTSIRQATPD